jgi:AcrR family transcriptional regulator
MAVGVRKVPRAVREQQMLAVATEVFAARGFHAAPMDEIAERAGVSKPMVYAYFESKEGLWRSCLAGARGRLFESIDRAVDTAAKPEEQLWVGVQTFFAFVDEEPESWALLDEAQAGPFIADVDEVRRQVARGVATLLRDAAGARGATEAALEQTEPLARTLVGAAEALANWWLEHPEMPRDSAALLLMNFAWLGFGDLVRGKRWTPPDGPASASAASPRRT